MTTADVKVELVIVNVIMIVGIVLRFKNEILLLMGW